MLLAAAADGRAPVCGTFGVKRTWSKFGRGISSPSSAFIAWMNSSATIVYPIVEGWTPSAEKMPPVRNDVVSVMPPIS